MQSWALYIVLFLAVSTSVHSKTDKKFNFFKGNKTSIKNPFNLRDPFKRLRTAEAEKDKSRLGGLYKDGAYSNMPSIDGIPISKIIITGVMLGKNRRAIAKVEGSESSFILKEGMKLGRDDAVLKAILPGGIVLVEKIKNVYDQSEYLETLIPISE